MAAAETSSPDVSQAFLRKLEVASTRQDGISSIMDNDCVGPVAELQFGGVAKLQVASVARNICQRKASDIKVNTIKINLSIGIIPELEPLCVRE